MGQRSKFGLKRYKRLHFFAAKFRGLFSPKPLPRTLFVRLHICLGKVTAHNVDMFERVTFEMCICVLKSGTFFNFYEILTFGLLKMSFGVNVRQICGEIRVLAGAENQGKEEKRYDFSHWLGGDSRATPPEEEGDGFANKIFGAIAPISGLSTSRKEGKFHY